tara:strand:+ start:257 stop:973 length:717 start_codon:yes stop_codon:yes gene_type:complete
MPSILITGANKGLGLGFAQRYAKDGWTVYASCRNTEKANALKELKKTFDVHVHQLDVLSHYEIEEYSKILANKPIDILFNNAGIQGPQPQNFNNTDYELWTKVFSTNVMSVMKMCETFVSNVEMSKKKLIVNVSSGTSSISQKTDVTPSFASEKGELYLYRSSKTALNMISRCMAWELRPRGISVVMLGPGWVRTNLGGPKAKFSIEESIENCVPMINSWSIKDSGKLLLYDGSEIPW